MEHLKNRIRTEGQNLGRGILKVDSFLNHQVDPVLMHQVGQQLARQFEKQHITKVLTAEISGIGPALMTALALQVPVIYARKMKPITMPPHIFVETAPSHTKGRNVELMVSPEFLGNQDRVLVVDDFLATGNTIAALIRICHQAQADVVGVAAVIEKSFEGGRAKLTEMGLPVYSAVVIEQMTDHEIIFAESE